MIECNIPSGHSFGQATSSPVGSVHPLCHIVPIISLLVAIHRPLSRHISGEPFVRLVAQHPLCCAFGLHGAYELSSGVPSRP